MATLRELFVKLGVQTDLAAVEAFEGGLEQVKTSAQGLVKVMGGLSAVLAGAGFAMLKMVQQTANAADAAATGAQRYGLTTEVFQELEHAAQLSGTNIEAMGDALKDLSMRAADAAKGGEGNVKMFRRLGVSLKGANGQLKSSDELMMDVADRIAKMKSPTEQLGAAVAAFGESGVKMLPMLRQGRRGIMEMREEARELGHVISADAAASFQDLNNNLMRGRKLLEGWRNRLAIALLPKVNELVERMLRWAKVNREVINSKIEDFAARVSGFIDDMARGLVKVNEKIEEWGGWEVTLKRIGKAMAVLGILKVAGHFIMMGNGIKVAVMALKGFKIAAIAALAKPIAIGAAVIALIAAIALAIEDVVVFMRGGDSLFGRFLEKFGRLEQGRELVESLVMAFKMLGRFLVALGGVAWDLTKVLLKVLGVILQYVGLILLDIVGPVLKTIFDFWADFFYGLSAILERIHEDWEVLGDAFKLMWSDIVQWFDDAFGGVINSIMEKISWVMEKVDKARALVDKIPTPTDAVRGVGNFFSKVGQRFAPSATNNPRSPASNNVQMSGGTTNITVNAETNASPEQIASVTASKVDDTNARWMRQTQAAFAGGEL